MSSEFDRGVKAVRDVVMAKCWDFQEDMKHSDGASSYTRDGEEITQGLYWDIDALLSKACCVPPTGWRCTRTAGHDGPCAAVPIEDGFPDSLSPAAKAELIAAAAPDLLAVARHCEALLVRYEINRVNGEAIEDEALALIRAAIAKATGATP